MEEKDTSKDETATPAPPAPGAVKPLPPLDFSTFVLSLSSSVLMNLGVVENPVTKKTEHEPLVAQQTIALLGLLKEKTQGNLTEQEGKLLDDVLHELHIWYCKVTDPGKDKKEE